MTRKRLFLIILIIATPILIMSASGDNRTGSISDAGDSSDVRPQAADETTQASAAEEQTAGVLITAVYLNISVRIFDIDSHVDVRHDIHIEAAAEPVSFCTI